MKGISLDVFFINGGKLSSILIILVSYHSVTHLF
jgi:hypothetical protein